MSRSTLGRQLYKFTVKPKSPAERIIEMYTSKLPARLPPHKTLNEKELDDIQKIFKHFDKNSDYNLNLREYHDFVQWSSGNTIGMPVNKVFQSIDEDENAKISLPEFVDYAARRKTRLPLKADLMKLFYKHDADDDGYLNVEEVRLVMMELGDQPHELGFLQAFSRMDSDKDGLLDADEFISFVKNHSIRAKLR